MPNDNYRALPEGLDPSPSPDFRPLALIEPWLRAHKVRSHPPLVLFMAEGWPTNSRSH